MGAFEDIEKRTSEKISSVYSALIKDINETLSRLLQSAIYNAEDLDIFLKEELKTFRREIVNPTKGIRPEEIIPVRTENKYSGVRDREERFDSYNYEFKSHILNSTGSSKIPQAKRLKTNQGVETTIESNSVFLPKYVKCSRVNKMKVENVFADTSNWNENQIGYDNITTNESVIQMIIACFNAINVVM